MPGALHQYPRQHWKLTLSIFLHCRRLLCCTSSEFADLASLSEMDSIEHHPVEFDKAYHDYEFHEAQLHYADSENPRIELVFRKDLEQAITTRSFRHDKYLRIISAELGYLDEEGVSMVELRLQFYHWAFEIDVPRACLNGHKDFSPSEMLC
ncbi:uncharacterized protein BDV17DRAFT_255529 [Aspergillus undulatus]|uniref:uncharacterized protein n=1 Tax=Aspergillus undulatus TaxID=1810928 RepID=UPI003CCD0D78